jgi:hypothetical protein
MPVPDIFPEMSAEAKALRSHRQREKRRGRARVEVTVRSEDAPLIRDVAKALNDPTQAAIARMLIRENLRFRSMGLKELLASAPLEGVDLSRPRDFGRDVDL